MVATNARCSGAAEACFFCMPDGRCSLTLVAACCSQHLAHARICCMLLCDFVTGGRLVCNAGWHINCLSGKHAITGKPDGNWYCPRHTLNTDEIFSAQSPKVQSSAQSPKQSLKKKKPPTPTSSEKQPPTTRMRTEPAQVHAPFDLLARALAF